MSIVLQHDPRVNITYAYHNESTWDKERKSSSSSRILIGKVDPKTQKVIKSSGARRKKQIDEAVIDSEIDAYNRKIDSEMRLESEFNSKKEFEKLRKQYSELQARYDDFGKMMVSFANSVQDFFENSK